MGGGDTAWELDLGSLRGEARAEERKSFRLKKSILLPR